MKACFAVILASASAVWAASPLEFKPTVLRPEDGPAFVPALRISGEDRAEFLLRADQYAFAEYELASTLTGQHEHNDEKTLVDLRFGLDWRIDKPLAAPEFPRTASGTRSALPPEKAWRWGSFSTELAFAFESDESFDRRQLAYGARVNYAPAIDRAAWQWFVPHVWADYRRIEERGDQVLTKGGSDQDYWRFGTQIYWQLALRDFRATGFWRDLKVVPGFEYYKATSLDVQEGDLADAFRYSLALDWAVPATHSWSNWLSAARLAVANGRIPPAVENRTTISLALTLRWDQLIPGL